jgi:hypothetical protein
MVHLIAVVLTLVAVQEPQKAQEPEEELIPGLPAGKSAALPERVEWDLAKAVVAQTSLRERVSLDGLWRFAPVPEREAPVVRAEMGWIGMPGHWASGGTRVYDARFRALDGEWRGKPIEEFSWAWAERDLEITNDTVAHWLSRRIFFVARGPWAAAEVYVSQQIPLRKRSEVGQQPETEIHVHAEQVEGLERDGERWFELTEVMIYPGTSQLSLRLPAEADEAPDDDVSPALRLEFVPKGPRVQSIRLRRDTKREEIEATLDLMRPVGFPTLTRNPPIRTIPMSLKLRLEDSPSDKTLQELEKAIGPLATHTRTVTLRLPWSSEKGQPPPDQARLRVWFCIEGDGAYDEPFPVEFTPAELEPAVD